MSENSPSLEDLIRRAIEARLADVHVAMPASVMSYDTAKQTARLKPLTRRIVLDEEDAPAGEDFPELDNVPVLFPRSGAWALHYPLTSGDSGLIICASRSFSEWRTTGNTSTPFDTRLHSPSHAVFIPGIFPSSNTLPNPSLISAAHAGPNGSGAQVIWSGATVDVRQPSGIALPVAKAAEVYNILQTLVGVLKSWVVVPNDGGAALQVAMNAAFPAASLPAIESTTLRAQ